MMWEDFDVQENQMDFQLIAKLSSTDKRTHDSLDECYEKLADYIHREIGDSIQKSSYNQKSALMNQLEETLNDAQLFLREPFLYGRATIGIVGCRSTEQEKDFLHQILGNQWPDEICAMRDLPCVLYAGFGQNYMLAATRNGCLIPISEEEYKEIVNLYRKKIDIKDLILSLNIPLRKQPWGMNYVRFPWYADFDTDEYRRLSALCCAFFVMWDESEPNRILPRPIFREDVPLFIVASEDNAEAKNYTEQLQQKQPGRNIRLLTSKECIPLLGQYIGTQNNFAEGEQIQALLMKLQAHEKEIVQRNSEYIEKLNRNSLFSEDLSQQLEELRKERIGLRNNAQSALNLTSKNIDEVNELMQKFVEQLRQTLPEKARKELETPMCTASSAVCQAKNEVLIEALYSGNFTLAEQCLNWLYQQHSSYAGLGALYLAKLQGKELPRFALENLRNNTAEDEAILHAKIYFAHELGIEKPEICRMASHIQKQNLNANERYYYAVDLEQKKGVQNSVIASYEDAFEAGSTEAGEWLTTYYFGDQEGKICIDKERFRPRKAKDLADSLIPRADFCYALYCLTGPSKKYAQGATYLRIAIALKYEPAIVYYADMLFNEVEKRHDDEKAKTAIALYQYAYKHSIHCENVTDKIGILYHGCRDYPNARVWFQKTKASHLPKASYCLGCMYFYGNGVAKNISQAKTLLEAAHKNGTEEMKGIAADMLRRIHKEQQRAAQKNTRSYSHDRDYSEEEDEDEDSSSSSGCFITTATCVSEGKPDDCMELNSFRQFRDEVLNTTEEGRALVKEYYRIAPGIVDNIARESNAAEIYHYLYTQYIAPGYELLQQGRQNETVQLYAECVLMLAKRYGVEVHAVPQTDKMV